MGKISYIEKDKQGKQHADEFQEFIKTATFENMVDPKLLKYLSPVELKNLRRWVNQFIKANRENDDKNMLAYPFQNKIVIITVAVMRHLLINGNGYRIGLPEINVNIGKNKNNLRIDVLEINKRKNFLVGYEVKSCIQDFRTDKKWRNYLNLINQLYFVFDIKTFEKYKEEILQEIGNDAGICTYNPDREWISLQHGGRAFEVEEKDEKFYRTILFNYLWRRAEDYFRKKREEYGKLFNE